MFTKIFSVPSVAYTECWPTLHPLSCLATFSQSQALCAGGYTNRQTDIHMYRQTDRQRTHTCTHARTHARTHTHIHTHTHTQADRQTDRYTDVMHQLSTCMATCNPGLGWHSQHCAEAASKGGSLHTQRYVQGVRRTDHLTGQWALPVRYKKYVHCACDN